MYGLAILMLTGFNHFTISVRDVERAFKFYRDVLRLKPLLKWSCGAYFLVGENWFCLNQDESTRNQPLPEYTHLAFSVSEADFENMKQRIINSKAVLFKENTSEGLSIYFLDPDGHKLEIHVGDWKTRLEHFKRNPKPGMEIY